MNKDFLRELIKTHTPSGYENYFLNSPGSVLLNYVLCGEHEIDPIKNIVFSKGSNDPDATKIMISAHWDENAMQVSNITKKGLLHIVNLGGLDRKTIEGSHVYVVSDKYVQFDEHTEPPKTVFELVPGVVGKKPIHKETKEEREKVDEYENIIVDIGCNSKEEVEELGIGIGAIVVFKKDYNIEFGYDKKHIVANGLDDKIGIYCVTEAFNQLDENYLKERNYKVYLVWCSQEEVGLRGATTISQCIDPDISIDVDVVFDNTYYKAKANENEIRLGKGVVIDYGPHINFQLAKDLKTTANNFAINYQEEVSKPGGNNCHAIQMNSKKCATAHLGIPQRNMHTQVEMCHCDDVEACVNLITSYINEVV